MKREFSTSWISSSQRRKQHKYIHNAPFHIRHRFLSAHLSKLLREKYKRRSFPVRKGDEVRIMRGPFRNKKAKVTLVNILSSRIALENIQRAKKDGTKVNVYFHPSKLQIVALNLEDKRRISALERNNSGGPNKDAPNTS